MTTNGSPRVIIVGGGTSGMGMVAALRRLGVANVLVVEREASTAGNDGSYTITGFEVKSVRHDDRRCVWTVTATDGRSLEASIVVLALDILGGSRHPRPANLDCFEGRLHLRGERRPRNAGATDNIAVIGAAADLVDEVPVLAAYGHRFTVFQSHPAWVLPTAAKGAPTLGKARRHVRSSVRDTWLQRQLMPTSSGAHSRVVLSDRYFPALQLPACTVSTWPIVGVKPGGILSADGIERRFDAIVSVSDPAVHQSGTAVAVIGSRSRTLDASWRLSPLAYRGTAISGFPNLFLTFGAKLFAENYATREYPADRINWAAATIARMFNRGVLSAEVRVEAPLRLLERLASYSINEPTRTPSALHRRIFEQKQAHDFLEHFDTVAHTSAQWAEVHDKVENR